MRVLLDEREIENGRASRLHGRIMRFKDDFHNSLERSDVAADRDLAILTGNVGRA